MYNTRSYANRRSFNAGKKSFKKSAKLKNQNKVKRCSRILGALKNNKSLHKDVRKNRKSNSPEHTVSLPFYTKGFIHVVPEKKAGPTDNNAEIKRISQDLYGPLQPVQSYINSDLDENNLSDFENSSPLRDTQNHQNPISNESEILRNCFAKIISTFMNRNRINTTKENNSKSIFREINDRYDELFLTNSIPVSEADRHLSNCIDINDGFYPDVKNLNQNYTNAEFTNNLKLNVVGFKTTESAKDRVISTINSILNNLITEKDKENEDMSETNQNKCVPTDEFDDSMNLQLVPPSSWVFRTPNDQKLKQLPIEEPSIDLKPAILQTSEDTKVLYEIDEHAAKIVNLENYAVQKRLVPIHPNITRQICEINLSGQDDDRLISSKTRDSWQEAVKELSSFKMPLSKHNHRNVLRDTTNLVREVTDPNKRHGYMVASSSYTTGNIVSPYKKDNRPFSTQRPIKTSKKSSRSFKKPPKKLTFEFDNKRQKMSLFDSSPPERENSPDGFNLDESQEAFNESFTFIKNDPLAMEVDCSVPVNYITKSPNLEADVECSGSNCATTGANLCASEVSYNLNDHFLSSFPKITETPTFKLYTRRNVDSE